MIDAIQQLVRRTDAALARLSLGVRRERNALITFLFHSLFRDENQIELNLIDPLERTTIAFLRRLIEYFLEHDYRFISPADLLAGLKGGGKYALLTFDDGYYNNTQALRILEEFAIPAVFFISTNHVRQNRCFWWDVLYRQLMAQGVSPARIYRESLELKRLKADQIEPRLSDCFGPDAHRPRSDLDRPFTPAELRDFAASRWVHLGNHTAEHAILTNYSDDEARAQIDDAQRFLRNVTGTSPIAIAYPNGAYDESTMAAAAAAGLKLGFTTRPRKSRLPLDTGSPALLELGRFVPHSSRSIASQCTSYRSDLQVYGLLRSAYLGMTGRSFAR